jgi:hypothetical protein
MISPSLRRRLPQAAEQHGQRRGAGIRSCRLLEMTPQDLVAVPSSMFAAERILERADLQRLFVRIHGVAATRGCYDH